MSRRPWWYASSRHVANVVEASGPPPATALSLTTQPSAAPDVDVAFSQQPVVQLIDADTDPVLESGVTVTASVKTGAGVLGGTLTAVTNASGVATFTDLELDTAGAHTLAFNAPGLTEVVSATVTVAAAPVEGVPGANVIATGTVQINDPFDDAFGVEGWARDDPGEPLPRRELTYNVELSEVTSGLNWNYQTAVPTTQSGGGFGVRKTLAIVAPSKIYLAFEFTLDADFTANWGPGQYKLMLLKFGAAGNVIVIVGHWHSDAEGLPNGPIVDVTPLNSTNYINTFNVTGQETWTKLTLPGTYLFEAVLDLAANELSYWVDGVLAGFHDNGVTQGGNPGFAGTETLAEYEIGPQQGGVGVDTPTTHDIVIENAYLKTN